MTALIPKAYTSLHCLNSQYPLNILDSSPLYHPLYNPFQEFDELQFIASPEEPQGFVSWLERHLHRLHLPGNCFIILPLA